MPYNEKLIQNIGRRISEDPFMKELKPFEVIFTENTCKIVLILGPQKANLFDGIIGFQPQENNLICRYQYPTYLRHPLAFLII